MRPRVVLAPADVEDCFYTAIEAVNIARKYSVPVFILSDQAIATRIEAFAEPDLEKICQDITPGPDAGGRPQALRPVRARWRHAARACPARASSAADIPLPPGWNTTNSAIRPARRSCTCR